VNNPIIQRELVGMLCTRKALLMQAVPACLFTLLVALRWPTDARVDLSGAQAQEVFALFGYGLLATLILLVPAFPATTIVREKNRGTLALLLNSPLSPWAIYFGKLTGVLRIRAPAAHHEYPGGGGLLCHGWSLAVGSGARPCTASWQS
jgi:ABC-type transport system involved in multi-copper enzyme maturation permease subunit